MSKPLTMLLVHAHPDDETIGTGGVMAKYAAEGARVVCVTCTGGEHGEIVVPALDTPENHARLAEIRAVVERPYAASLRGYPTRRRRSSSHSLSRAHLRLSRIVRRGAFWSSGLDSKHSRRR